MIDDLPRDEAERLLSLTKFGDPSTGWNKHKEAVSLAKCVFGMTDADGRRIQGMTAQLSVRYGRRPPFRRFVFGMYHAQNKSDRRAYQLEIVQGSRPITDPHRYSHEHVGRDRIAGLAEWSGFNYASALRLFCKKTNLTLTCVLPDPSVPESK